MSSCLKIKHADKSFHMIPPCISNAMMFSREELSEECCCRVDSKQEFFFTSFSHLSAREYIFLSVYSRFILLLPKPAELTFCRQSTVRKYSITMNQMPDQGSNFFTPFPSRIKGAGWWVACRGRIRWNLTC